VRIAAFAQWPPPLSANIRVWGRNPVSAPMTIKTELAVLDSQLHFNATAFRTKVWLWEDAGYDPFQPSQAQRLWMMLNMLINGVLQCSNRR
jgi:hypothetical protein